MIQKTDSTQDDTALHRTLLWLVFLVWLLTAGEPDLLDAIIERVGRP